MLRQDSACRVINITDLQTQDSRSFQKRVEAGRVCLLVANAGEKDIEGCSVQRRADRVGQFSIWDLRSEMGTARRGKRAVIFTARSSGTSGQSLKDRSRACVSSFSAAGIQLIIRDRMVSFEFSKLCSFEQSPQCQSPTILCS